MATKIKAIRTGGYAARVLADVFADGQKVGTIDRTTKDMDRFYWLAFDLQGNRIGTAYRLKADALALFQ